MREQEPQSPDRNPDDLRKRLNRARALVTGAANLSRKELDVFVEAQRCWDNWLESQDDQLLNDLGYWLTQLEKEPREK